MAAGLAHEIKNPLAGIRAAMNYFSSTLTLDGDDREVFDRVVSETRRIESMIKDLLSYARPHKSNFIGVDFNKLVEKSMGLLPKYRCFARKGESQIEIVTDFDVDLSEVEVDPLQQQQVLLNLLLNAGDAMPAGGVLTVRTIYDSAENIAKVLVVDTGNGIKPAVMRDIFQPFFTTKAKGTGLGLATSKRLIEQHGGSLTVHSTLGEGTTFTINIPITQEGEV
jgi:two-component system sensor histidine kinase AtoS